MGVVSLWKPLSTNEKAGADKASRRSEPVNDGQWKFTPTFGFDTNAKGPDLKKDYAKEYRHALKDKSGEKPGLLLYVEPDAAGLP